MRSQDKRKDKILESQEIVILSERTVYFNALFTDKCLSSNFKFIQIQYLELNLDSYEINV